MKLKALSFDNMELIREWRNECMETLRTPYLLTEEMQTEWFEDIICNRNSNIRYWEIWEAGFIGYGGIENIQWENRLGEISILIRKDCRICGYGKEAIDMFLDQAFNSLNLENVWGECYYSSAAIPFWQKIIKEKNAYFTILPNRKYYDGRYWDSLYFSFSRNK